MSASTQGTFSRLLKAINPFRVEGGGDRRQTVRMHGNTISCSIGEIVDLSATGARVRCRRFFRPLEGRSVSLAIESPSLTAPLTIDGVVCWTASEGDSWYAGVAFNGLSESDALALGLLLGGHDNASSKYAA